MAPRDLVGYECDHMRPVVHISKTGLGMDEGWFHIVMGEAVGRCEAGVYKVSAQYVGDHPLKDLVPAEDES